jgi:hypothetical protein
MLNPVTRTHKNCSGCGLFLTLDKFHNMASSPDGKQGLCKKCRRQLYREGKELAAQVSNFSF